MKKPAKLSGNKFNFNSEVIMKNVKFQKGILLSSSYDMVEAVLKLHKPANVRFDKETGEEIGAADAVTPMLTDIYTPSELVEFEVEYNPDLCFAEGYVSDASLCINDLGDIQYEPDFNDLINQAYEEPVMVSKDQHISPEQQETNFNYYMAKLKACKFPKELYAWKDMMLDIQKNTKSGAFMFAAGKSAELWGEYHTVKYSVWEAVNNKRAEGDAKVVKKVREYAEMVVKYSDYSMLKRISDEIYHDFMPVSVKKALWAKIRIKQQSGSVSFDTVKMDEYVKAEMEAMRSKKAASSKAA